MKQMIAVFVILLVSLGTALAQAPSHGPSVAFTAPETTSVESGKTGTVTLLFRVAGGFHVNSNHPHEDYLIPTELKLDPPPGIMVSKLDFPAGKDLSFPFAPDEKLSVYSDDFSVDVHLHALNTALPASYKLKGVLKFQACDNRACYPPKTTAVEFAIAVVKSLPASKPATARKRSGSQ